MTFKEAIEKGLIPEPVSWYSYKTGEGNEEGKRRVQQLVTFCESYIVGCGIDMVSPKED